MQNMVNRLVTKKSLIGGNPGKNRSGRRSNGCFGPQIGGPENLEHTMIHCNFNKETKFSDNLKLFYKLLLNWRLTDTIILLKARNFYV